jgi:cell wall-associated NlpC family hydrolase
MKKNNILYILIILLSGCTSMENDFVKTNDYVTSKMCNADFWIKRIPQPNKVILSPQKIEKLNNAILDTPETYVTDLAKRPETINFSKSISRMQEYFSFLDQTDDLSDVTNDFNEATTDTAEENKMPVLFKNDNFVDKDFFIRLRENICNTDLTGDININYGICVNRTNMKAWPVEEIITDTPDDPEFDVFTSSVVDVNEPVLVYYPSVDKNFLYVRAYDCSGWVKSCDIAICKDKEEWLEAQNMKDFIIVTGEKIFLETSDVSANMSKKMLTMGTKLPLINPEDIPETINFRSTAYNYIVRLPIRMPDGSFATLPTQISFNRDVHVGYLPCTRANIINQAFKMLGNRYGWGGMLDAVDCSLMVQDIYKCFGVNMPRNTSWQAKIPAKVITDINKMPAWRKKIIFNSMQAGDILQLPGHTMFYLGKVGKRYYTIDAVSHICDNNNIPMMIRSVAINTLDTKRSNGTRWFDSISKVIFPNKKR